MKLNRLTLAILLASSTTLLISCGDDDKKPESKKEAPVAVEQQKMDDAQLADKAEARYRGFVSLSEKLTAKASKGNQSPWQDVKTVVENYTKTDTGATAEQTSTMTPKANFAFIKKPVVVTSKDTITYNQDLLKQGIVAKVNYDANFGQLADSFEGTPEMKAFIEGFSKHSTFETDLLTGDNVKTTMKTAPFSVDLKEDGKVEGKVQFTGLEMTYSLNEKTVLENVGAVDFHATLSPVTIKPETDKGTVTIEKLAADYSLSPAGDLSIKVSPLTVKVEDHESNETAIFNVDGLEQSGKGIVFDESLGSYLGETTGKIGDLSLTKDGEKTTFAHFTFGSKTEKNSKGNFDLSGNLDTHFNGESIKKLAELPILLKELTVKSNVENLSPELSEIFSKMSIQINQETDEAAREKIVLEAFNALTKNITANQTHFAGSFDLTTDAGDAHVDFKLAPRGGEGNPVDWEQAINQAEENPMALIALLQEQVDFSMNIKVKRDLVAAFGMAELVEMQGAGMIENKDGFFIVNIENTPEGLTINGQRMF